jgi:hypothetical protein
MPVRGDGEEESKVIPEICTAELYKPVEWLCSAVCGDNRNRIPSNSCVVLAFVAAYQMSFDVILKTS